jgi:glutathione peroxidase
MHDFHFDGIDGRPIPGAGWAGRPVLVVNTASRCGLTPQYAGLQQLQDRYGDRGLVVLAVPSNDFAQELGSEAEVREFCETSFGLTLPMTAITRVTGEDAHPFYRWLAQEHGFQPGWNFAKVLVGRDGSVTTFGHRTEPLDPQVVAAVEAALG